MRCFSSALELDGEQSSPPHASICAALLGTLLEAAQSLAFSRMRAQVKHPWRSICKKDYRPELCIAFFVPFLQQLTGVQHPCLASLSFHPLLADHLHQSAARMER